ncbi:hypothetical protein CK203_115917 [Vitis vinifera]|uniref:Uncharacterized protein n=1 Tax=Vitis vinifera TaxID=29760 RepID=A0A438CBT6_VITVI|nr:hypothetical protein CK203_115917 [Vitis vinifera]
MLIGLKVINHPPNEENVAFIMPHGLFCYKVMPVGLKNARTTYQRLIDYYSESAIS